MIKLNVLKKGLSAIACVSLMAAMLSGCGNTAATAPASTAAETDSQAGEGSAINTQSTFASALNSNFKFGTGSVKGYYYPYGNAIAEKLSDMPIEVKNSAGSVANLRLMGDDYIQLAFVQSDSVFNAWNGLKDFDKNPVRNYGAVARLYTEPVHIVVAADSPINSVADLKGRAVSVGELQSGVINNAEEILMAYGMDFDDIDQRNLSFADSAEAFNNGEIEAFFITACYPVPAIQGVTKPVKLINIGDEEYNWIKKFYGYYDQITIPAGTYEGQTEDCTTVGVGAILLASNMMSEEDIEKVTAAVVENNADLSSKAGISSSLTLEECTKDVPVQFHPGAMAYYQKQGVTVK